MRSLLGWVVVGAALAVLAGSCTGGDEQSTRTAQALLAPDARVASAAGVGSAQSGIGQAVALRERILELARAGELDVARHLAREQRRDARELLALIEESVATARGIA